jgi:hypothetical protein
MRAGVFNPRNVRRLSGDRPKLSRLNRRDPLLDTPPLFKANATTPLASPEDYTKVSAKAHGIFLGLR